MGVAAEVFSLELLLFGGEVKIFLMGALFLDEFVEVVRKERESGEIAVVEGKFFDVDMGKMSFAGEGGDGVDDVVIYVAAFVGGDVDEVGLVFFQVVEEFGLNGWDLGVSLGVREVEDGFLVDEGFRENSGTLVFTETVFSVGGFDGEGEVNSFNCIF